MEWVHPFIFEVKEAVFQMVGSIVRGWEIGWQSGLPRILQND